jgi:hypothetical protein
MAIREHLKTFAGLKVQDYVPGSHFWRGGLGLVAYRLGIRQGPKPGHSFTELLDLYLAEPGAERTTGLVVGAWDYEEMAGGGAGNSAVVQALVAVRERLPDLRSLFLGDVTYEECELSWLTQGDVGPLFTAYPRLEEFRVRGANRLTFGRLRHDNLRSLAVETGGLPAAVLEEIGAADLPRLERLELWLGTPEYGGIADAVPLEPLLSGRGLPRLRYLGLRNSRCADAVARALVRSPLLERLRVLDLSLGNLSDDGARALLLSAAVARLARLDIHHHYVSRKVVADLRGLGIDVDADGPQEPDTDPSTAGTEDDRYNAISE